jgi:RNA polymerase sigma-70 factor (ECF subfamily)
MRSQRRSPIEEPPRSQICLSEVAPCSGAATTSIERPVLSDDELTLLARSGARAAFDQLIRRYQARVIGIALRHTGNLAIAQEVAQEAFVDLLRALPRYEARGKFSAFLFRLVINRCRMEFRSRRRIEKTQQVGAHDADQADATSLHLMLDRERARQLGSEIQRLGKPLRDVLALWGDGAKDKEIAEILGAPIGTVRRRRFDALERLRARLEGK